MNRTSGAIDDDDIPLQRPQPYRYYSSFRVSDDHERDAQVLLPKRPRHSSMSQSVSSNVTERYETWKSCMSAAPTMPWTTILIAVLILQFILAAALGAHVFTSFCAAIDTSQAMEERYSLICHSGPGPVLLATTIVESVYQVVLAIDAVRSKNMVQVLGLCFDDAAMLIFIVLAYFAIADLLVLLEDVGIVASSAAPGIRSASLALIVLVGLTLLLLCGIAWKLYGEFQWAIYQHISKADVKLRRLYLIYEVYIALLHLDFFFLLGCWAQSITGVRGYIGSPSQLVGIYGVAITPFHLVLAGFSVKREWIVGQVIVLLLFFLDIGLLGYVVSTMYDSALWNVDWFDGTRSRETAYMALAMPVLAVTIVMGCISLTNTGRGLKPHLQNVSVPAVSGLADEERYGRYTHARQRSQQLDEGSLRNEID